MNENWSRKKYFSKNIEYFIAQKIKVLRGILSYQLN